MSARHSQVVCLALGAFLLLVAGCGDGGGEQSSFGSSKIQAVPTNVSGSGTTSGIGAGAALAPPGGSTSGAGSPTPTTTPTVTPAPSK
jgi:hypothetical protein